MLPEREVWHAAKLLIDRYGDDAPAEAAQRAAELRAEGDIGGEAVWFRIENACRELLRSEPDPRERVS